MSLLTPDELEDHVDTGLGQPALQRLLDDAEEEIIRRFGPHQTQIDYFDGGSAWLFPTRVINSVSEIVETDSGDDDTTLSSDDYDVLYEGRALYRRSDGTNSRSTWDVRIKVTYVPKTDLAQRERVQIDLVQLALAFTGIQSHKSGNYSESALDYEKERERILQRLAPRHKVII